MLSFKYLCIKVLVDMVCSNSGEVRFDGIGRDLAESIAAEYVPFNPSTECGHGSRPGVNAIEAIGESVGFNTSIILASSDFGEPIPA